MRQYVELTLSNRISPLRVARVSPNGCKRAICDAQRLMAPRLGGCVYPKTYINGEAKTARKKQSSPIISPA
jgi:hypothetical protein